MHSDNGILEKACSASAPGSPGSALNVRPRRAGELVLLEAPVATVVRSQYVRDVCHVCFRDLPPSPQQQAQQAREPCPYKRYCSRACAEADTHAGVTQVLHQLVAQENTKVEARPLPSF